MKAISRLPAALLAVACAAIFAMPLPAQEQLKGAEHWIGVFAGAVPAPLQAHLNRDKGVMVEEIAENSPAAKAGVKKYDVLLAFGGVELSDAESLIDAVAKSEGKETELTLIRGGDEMKLAITPEKRSSDNPFGAGPRRVTNREEVERFFGQGPGADGRRMFFFGPGMMRSGQTRQQIEMPQGSLSITKKEGEPAKIIFQQGDKTYEATEDKLDELPEEARAAVKRMLARSEETPRALVPFEGAPRSWIERQEELMRRMQQQFEELRRSMEESQRARAGENTKKDL